jgi:hypothetical protein
MKFMKVMLAVNMDLLKESCPVLEVAAIQIKRTFFWID